MPPVTLKNKVNPLTWNVPITNKDGTPTYEFQVKWLQQATANANVTDLSSGTKVSAVLDLIGSGKGSILYRGAIQWNTLSGAAGHDGWVLTWNDTTGLPEWRAVASGGGGGASSFWLDGTDGYAALVDSNGLLVLDSLGRGIYSKDPVLPAAMIPNPAGYVTGTLGATVVNKVKGVTNGSNAAPGDVGEYLEASIVTGSSVALTAGTPANVVFLDLPAGDWEVRGKVAFNGFSGITTTFLRGALNSVSATLPSPEDISYELFGQGSGATGLGGFFAITPKRFNVAVTTRVYMIAQADSGSGIGAYGTVAARRVR